MELIGIFATFTGTANGAAQIQIPRSGRIRGVQFSMYADLDADLEQAVIELSFLPVFQSTTNNTRNLLANFILQSNLTTSGSIVSAVSGFYPLDLPVTPLQIVYVNGVLTGTANAGLSALLHFA